MNWTLAAVSELFVKRINSILSRSSSSFGYINRILRISSPRPNIVQIFELIISEQIQN